MAKKENATTAVAKNGSHLPATTQALVNNLKNAKVGIEITGEYYQFEEGEEVDFYIIGVKEMTAMNEPDKKIDAIALIDGNGDTYITAEIVLRSTLGPVANQIASGEKKPMPVRVVCTGSTKGPKGSYKTFKVNMLEIVDSE